jgi:GEVED domain/Secretion system C-terminal sorting domain
LGNTFDHEWNITTSANADADGSDEDGLGAAPPLLGYNGTTNYNLNNITVYNNTGANATLIGWLDYNFDGVFNTGEGILLPIATNAAPQTVNLSWIGITVPNNAFTKTFLRLRLTSAVNGMTTANMNGYFNDGEVEDYAVLQGAEILPIQLLDFNAEKISGKQEVNIMWKFTGADQLTYFSIERSLDGISWNSIGKLTHEVTDNNTASLSFTDNNPLDGKSYYRIQWTEPRVGSIKYSVIKSVVSGNQKRADFDLLINPATSYSVLNIHSLLTSNATIDLINSNGRVVTQKKTSIHAGENTVTLDGLSSLPAGLYVVHVQSGANVFNAKLLIHKQ